MKRIIFMGTPEFGANALQTLIDLNHKPVLVICQPDKKRNRKKEIVFSPVKQLALKHQIPILQPDKIQVAYDEIAAVQADVMLTAAYGQFVPEKILKLFPLGAWNIHGSLLPQLRGGAPIHWAIINNNSNSGVSLMQMIQKMDAGGVIAKEHVEIESNETYQSLLNKLLVATQKILISHFESILQQTYQLETQDETKVTFGYNIQKTQTFIDWKQPAHTIDCFIRGLYNQPLAQTYYQTQIIKIYSSQITSISTNATPGTIVAIDDNGISVATGDQKIIQLQKIQLSSKKAMTIKELINGNHIFQINTKFGNYDSKIN